MITEAPGALRADACPEPERLASYIDGTLAPAERTILDHHLVACAECRDIVADTMAATPSLVDARRRSPVVKWIAAAGGLVAAAATFVVMLRTPAPRLHVSEMAPLVSIVGAHRPLEPRLAEFPYAPTPVVTRGPAEAANFELAARADQIREEIAGRTGDPANAARGVLYLLLGKPDDAVKWLELASSSPSVTPQMWSDLAAAYLARGAAGDFERALAAADRAVTAKPDMLEGSFNRALALEALGRRADAAAAWNAYLSHDSASAWAAEARDHLARSAR
jgi:hypothetical protein